eukprot:scaffold92905_cov15-Prasinocladus_malaysianus.AAC.1
MCGGLGGGRGRLLDLGGLHQVSRDLPSSRLVRLVLPPENSAGSMNFACPYLLQAVANRPGLFGLLKPPREKSRGGARARGWAAGGCIAQNHNHARARPVVGRHARSASYSSSLSGRHALFAARRAVRSLSQPVKRGV